MNTLARRALHFAQAIGIADPDDELTASFERARQERFGN